MKTRVKELRTAAKMTQQQLADLVHVSSRTIISIEKEQYSPLSYAGLQNGSGVWGDNRGFMLLKGEQRIGGQKV